MPRQLLLFSIAVALVTPLVARLPGAALTGGLWLEDFLPGFASPFFLALNLVPAVVLYGLGRLSRSAPSAFWWATAGCCGALLGLHGSLDLRSSSTAALGLLFVPFVAAAAAVGGWIVGRALHAVAGAEVGRKVGWVALGLALLAGLGLPVQGLLGERERLANRPGVTVNEVAMQSRVVYSRPDAGRVSALAVDELDGEPGQEIAVLANARLALLAPGTYAVKADWPLPPSYRSFVVGDGAGGVWLGDDDGLLDRNGARLWNVKAASFSSLQPFASGRPDLGFVAWHINERFDVHDRAGKLRWSVHEDVLTVGAYESPTGEALLFSAAGYEGQPTTVKLYAGDGTLVSTLSWPTANAVVAGVAWPTRGHWLAGTGRGLEVLDPEGKPVLRHEIEGLSFAPASGPVAVPVRLRPDAEPYLAAIRGGNSGDPRSVLVVFAPGGRLVYQAEMDRVSTLVAVEAASGSGQVLLVGGEAGVHEYSLGVPNP